MQGDKPAIVINLFVYYAQAGRIIVAWRDCKCRRGEHCRTFIYPQDICLSGPRWPSTAADGLNILSIAAAAAAPACVSDVKGRTERTERGKARPFPSKKGVNTHTVARTQRLLFIRFLVMGKEKITRRIRCRNNFADTASGWLGKKQQENTSEIFIAKPSGQKRHCVFCFALVHPDIGFFLFFISCDACVHPKQQSDGYDIC